METSAVPIENSEAVSELLYPLSVAPPRGVQVANESRTPCSRTGHEIDLQMLGSILDQCGSALCRAMLALFAAIDTQALRPCDVPVTRQAKYGAEICDLRAALFAGDEQEHKATWNQLRQLLDEDRLSDRKLFP